MGRRGRVSYPRYPLTSIYGHQLLYSRLHRATSLTSFHTNQNSFSLCRSAACVCESVATRCARVRRSRDLPRQQDLWVTIAVEQVYNSG